MDSVDRRGTRTTDVRRSCLWLALLVSGCVPVTPEPRVGVTIPSGAPSEAAPARDRVPLVFDLPSLDDRSVSAPAFRGKPVVLAFVTTDSLAGQAEADILATLARDSRDVAHYVVVAVEPEEKRELVQGFLRFFSEKTKGALLGAMADKDVRIGQGPFGDVRDQTVVVLDAQGRIAFRKTGIVQAGEITRALGEAVAHEK
jgi:hypothetical protein